MRAKGSAREASIAVTVIRADGTVEERGVVSRWHRNPLIRLKWRVADLLRSLHGHVSR